FGLVLMILCSEGQPARCGQGRPVELRRGAYLVDHRAASSRNRRGDSGRRESRRPSGHGAPPPDSWGRNGSSVPQEEKEKRRMRPTLLRTVFSLV
uniref:Uncharacterized protein n=1 Tax=Aegilops tauschii subsp. strangulata TaxID=200361 RepID=A0A452YPC3_AEGTS